MGNRQSPYFLPSGKDRKPPTDRSTIMTTATAATAIDQLQKLERELIGLAHYDEKLSRALRRGANSVHDEVMLRREQLRVTNRIEKALAEVRAIDEAYIRRNPEISNLASWFSYERPLVRFFGIEAVG